MAEIKLTFAGKLSCGKCEDVLLWLHNPTKLAANAGITDPTKQTQLIQGSITDITAVNSSNYQYTIEYDENLLLDPNSLLQECDIKQLCCAGCVIQYVDEAVASKSNSVLVDNGDNSFTHTSGDGTVTTVSFGHSLSSTVNGTTTTITLTKPDGTTDDVQITIPVAGGSFTCDPDFDTWLGCLEAIKDGTGCTYDVDPLGGRFDTYPLTLTRIETVNGDITFNISGNSLADLVANLNAAAINGYTFTVNGNLLRILSAPDAVNRVEFTDGTDLDWRPAQLLQFSCTTVDPNWERFCACVNQCVTYEIYLQPAPNENILVLEGGGGTFSTVDLCPAVTNCLQGLEAFVIEDATGNSDGINLGETVFFLEGQSISQVVSVENTLTTSLLLSGDVVGGVSNFAEFGTGDGNVGVWPSTDPNNFIVSGSDGRMYVFPSTDAGNNIVTGSDGGIYINIPGTTVNTDNTIDGDGSAGNPLSVPVSTDAGNLLVLGSDGKHFIDCGSIIPSCLNVAPAPNGLAGDGTTGNPLIVSPSTDPGNTLVFGGDGGLFVAAAPETVTTFVDNGNGTFTYTNEAGVATVICQGPNTVTNPGGCLGIGSANMVRSLTINGCVLDISSAPEHTAFQQVTNAVSDGINLTVNYNGPPTNIVTVGDTCRDMIVNIAFLGELTINWKEGNTLIGNLFYEVEIDGGGFNPIGLTPNVGIQLPPGHPLHTHYYSAAGLRPLLTVPAGTTSDISIRLRWEYLGGVNPPPPNDVDAAYTIALAVYAYTV